MPGVIGSDEEYAEEVAKVVGKGQMMKELIADSRFKALIMEDYIQDNALGVGTDFSASEEDMDTLKAISHLNRYMHRVIQDSELALQDK